MTTDNVDCIEACRTCGVYYLTTSNFLRPIFSAAVDDPEMLLIRLELSNWKVNVDEKDGLPQFICTGCIYEFQKFFKFRRSCVDMQEQLRQFNDLRQNNLIKIKTEVIETPDNTFPFIYVDDLSDDECGGAVTPFNIPHVPIKEEVIEAATVLEENYINESPKDLSEVDALQGSMLSPQKQNWQAAVLSQIQCEQCQHMSSTRKEHQQHMQHAHNTKNHQCHICGKSFKNCTAARLKLHLKFHKISKHIKCTQCNVTFGTRKALAEHKQTVHVRFRCTHCSKPFSTKRKREEHMVRAHAVDESLSTIAPVQFVIAEGTPDNHGQLGRPAEKEHPIDEYADVTATNDIETMSTAFSKETQEQCETNSDDSEVGSGDSSTYCCAQCPQKFTTLDDLKYHHKQHIGKPVFKCHICGKLFDLTFGLKRHLKKHTRAPF